MKRILEMEWIYVENKERNFQMKMMKEMVKGLKKVEKIKIGEIWEMNQEVRYLMIENERRIEMRVESEREMRNIEKKEEERIVVEDEGEEIEGIMEKYEQDECERKFEKNIIYRLRQ